jgi:GT2 family glycosyltransferase
MLRRCLDSIAAGTSQPTQVLVSDDSSTGDATQAVCAAYPKVRYLRGPRKGLCANRNAVIQHVSTGYVSLLDDDAVVSVEFASRAFAVIADLPDNVIITGTVIETDHATVPNNPSFWGHFTERTHGRFENVNLNCNLLPRHAFSCASFDETIVYGYEDTDLCACLLSQGFRIHHDSSLVNTHLPPPQSASTKRERHLNMERARFYISLKRYLLWKEDIPKFLAFIILAPLHRMASAIKNGRWFELPHCLPDIVFALRAALLEKARVQASAVHTVIN